MRYLQTGVFDTVVTKSIDGRPQRVIRTPVIDRLERTSRLFRATGALRSAIAFRKLGDASFGRLMKSGVSMHHDSNLSWSQVVMAANAPMLTKAALVDGREDAGILPTGQVVGVIEELISVSDLIDEIIREALECLARIEGLVHE